ncbi:protein of unknown function DUF1289 [Rhodobacter ferrooxidans]|uniref:DUF1289 domain-containing protein n=2 Tax=Rhodobacter ferrooxidans TaxID=371731 RepID=C8RZC5_9RHOB|nr:protein of unknown function DUF1289 [Rhodobacter sp. SW2]
MDNIWARDEVQSPCVKICVIHPTEHLCIGCLRSMAEIASWSQLTPARRAEIIAELPARAPRLAKRRGGRNGRQGE